MRGRVRAQPRFDLERLFVHPEQADLELEQGQGGLDVAAAGLQRPRQMALRRFVVVFLDRSAAHGQQFLDAGGVAAVAGLPRLLPSRRRLRPRGGHRRRFQVEPALDPRPGVRIELGDHGVAAFCA